MKPRYRTVAKENMDLSDPTEFPEQILYNLARYKFAAGLLKPSDVVLDLACGYGFGTYFLSCYCQHAYGADINPEVIEVARSRYLTSSTARDKITFISCFDAEKDDIPEIQSVIVSFDTIEHLNDPEKFVKKCLEALPPGGLFICGSPQKKDRPDPNPFHISEMTSSEFFGLLDKYSRRVLRFSQNEDIVGIFNEERAWGMIGVCFAS